MSVRRTVTPVRGFGAGSLLALGAILLLAGCGGGGSNGQTAAPTTAPATKAATATTPTTAASPPSTARPQASDGEIDACALVTKAEVEAAVGAAVLDPKPEQMANLALQFQRSGDADRQGRVRERVLRRERR